MSARLRPAIVGAMKPWRRAALQRRNSLARLAALRRGNLGADRDWAIVLANVLEALCESVTDDSIRGLALRLGIELADDAVAVGLAFRLDRDFGYGAGGRLVSAKMAGDLLQLTRIERDLVRITDIDAYDEPKLDRQRRLDREALARRRGAAGVRPATPPTATQAKPWQLQGISRATWYRRRRETPNVVPPSSKSLVIETGFFNAHTPAMKNTTNSVSKPSRDSVPKPKNLNILGTLERPRPVLALVSAMSCALDAESHGRGEKWQS